MDLVTRPHVAACALVVMLASFPATACDVDRWQPHIAEASRKYDVPEIWIRAVMRAESAGCTSLDGQPIRSSVGAMGLMQLMPATWTGLRQRHRLGEDPDEPRDNILAGTAYLRELADRFDVPGAFAAYNAGPGRYEEYLLGRPLPLETRHYLAQVSEAVGLTGSIRMANGASRSTADPLFVVVARSRSAPVPRGARTRDARLFIRLQGDGESAVQSPPIPVEQADVQQ